MTDTTEQSITASDARIDELAIHVARPSGGSATGVLLYPTIAGLDEHMRAQAATLAEEGLTAVVWDPYDGNPPAGGRPAALELSKSFQDEDIITSVTKVLDYMEDELGLTSFSAWGWCFGGRVALLHAGLDSRIGAVAAYNPTIWGDQVVEFGPMRFSGADFPGETMDVIAGASAVRGPVQICHPENDFTPQDVYDALITQLRERSAPTAYEYYPGIGHGFGQGETDADAAARAQAWPRTLAVLSEPTPRA
ncbi:dienelactone hydrolase family protein [Leucobacter allii]|uniref:Dienelactone hydrolase family protein n=1 Tax=Leucobacter allii TaxID=2932247 RepID=A0ABY4FJ02_9MICO|nr:dienelactone hydrolase family protein [Leucobacter allii]UOQ56375.1 dienelactone hydrolase family protein [Leucobacter allii]